MAEDRDVGVGGAHEHQRPPIEAFGQPNEQLEIEVIVQQADIAHEWPRQRLQVGGRQMLPAEALDVHTMRHDRRLGAECA